MSFEFTGSDLATMHRICGYHVNITYVNVWEWPESTHAKSFMNQLYLDKDCLDKDPDLFSFKDLLLTLLVN